MSKKKYYNKSKEMPTIASIRKGVNATIEHLRHAEEGTLAYDIYQKGTEVKGNFAIEYCYVAAVRGGDLVVKDTYMILGYFAQLKKSGIWIKFPDVCHISRHDVQKMISDILPSGVKFSSVPDNDCTYYLIPLTPLVEKCILPCLAELDDYIRTALIKQSNDLLYPFQSGLGLKQPNQ